MDEEKLLELSRGINVEYEPGISQEISDFFSEWESVLSYTYEFESNIFVVSVKLSDFNFQKVRELFSSFILFIEYDSTFYVREHTTEKVKYTLLSKMNVINKGFLCEVVFS
ncbi:hypothetical protein D7Z54_20865 [Salibacterium salarium]|uniref:Uncharacterized protein n=1 Tax=Salibacterium salarium TaxID=284579 RepID=A0A428MZN3_9BACI|nr:hypothetical protein [Salibacterium salarium]RSL31489.1 hypothetical protein D7Z54_20865 [Salibacterium salarium]